MSDFQKKVFTFTIKTMRFKIFFLILSLFFCLNNTQAQINNKKPKLIVGLVIDQMRWDYLYRYANRYTDGGFKRLQKNGYSFENTFIPYTPTVTAAGHACIYTGAVPATNGIVGNDWYDKATNKKMYCTDDSTVHGIGNNDEQGKMSPRNLYATTITDELRLSNNFKSKVIGIALKDRGAILPAGHSANTAYWYDDVTGKWITSNYYANTLPAWVTDYNAKNKVSTYMTQDWNTIYPIATYTQSTNDDNNNETDLGELKSHKFPYKLSLLDKKKYSIFKYTPYANSYSFDFAKETIVNENMGSGPETDFLALSISSTDYIGHTFGPNSIETEDTYLRLDKDIAEFLKFLDLKIGTNNYTLFLSADHGAAHTVNFLKDNKLPAGIIDSKGLKADLKKLCIDAFGLDAILDIQNFQIYLDYNLIKKNNIDDNIVTATIIAFLKEKEFVQNALDLNNLQAQTIAEPIKTRLINGYDNKRSGDIQIILKPGFSTYKTGTGHTVWNPYDAHIPLIFYGNGIVKGKTHSETYMTDIAPTLAALLNIQMPSGCVGKALVEVVK